jgi:hypothetical protein
MAESPEPVVSSLYSPCVHHRNIGSFSLVFLPGGFRSWLSHVSALGVLRGGGCDCL